MAGEQSDRLRPGEFLRCLVRRLASRKLGPAAGLKLAFQHELRGQTVTISPRALGTPVTLRGGSTDFLTFNDIILYDCYRFALHGLAPEAVEFVVDAGANIGMASLAFAQRFPKARIVAIEPEAGNFEMLETNCAPCERVEPLRGALWPADGCVVIDNPDAGRQWAFRVGEAAAGEEVSDTETIRAVSVGTLMRECGWDRIDVLKIDIEGAERTLFEGEAAADWIGRVNVIVIELHDTLAPGASRAFFKAIEALPDYVLSVSGENLVIGRREPVGIDHRGRGG